MILFFICFVFTVVVDGDVVVIVGVAVTVVVVFVFVVDDPRNLPLKFGQYQISNSSDIADIEFLWWVGGSVLCKVIFMSNPTKVMLS